ncbi:MAG: hypothetical protein JWO06_2165 [Bacteroidota bacterium]|nr:hypothetical protein [Bacteroidota bacterium]
MANTADEYYKIPDGATYNGQQMINKAGHLTLTSELGHNYYIINDTVNNTGFLYTEVKAADYKPTDKARAPLNISIVLDRSGSMSGAKLESVKKAADFLIDKLDGKDILSIVTFESGVGVLQKSAPVTDKAYLHEIVKNIVVGGSTNLGGGLLAGFDQVRSTYKSGYVNRVLLLSDGVADSRTVNGVTIESLAKKWFTTESISVSTFGVGTDYNENLMTTLAENGGGNYYFIKEPDMIPKVFEKEISGLLTLMATKSTLTFKLPAALSILRVYGGNYDMDKNEMTVKLNDIFANETKGILIKFKIKPGTSTELPITTQLTFEDATDKNKPLSVQNLNVIKPITDVKMYLANFSEKVMQQCTMFESNDLMEKTMKAVDDRDYEKAQKLGAVTQDYFKSNSSKMAPTTEMWMQDSVVINYNTQLKDMDKKGELEIQNVQKASKSSNYLIRTKK